MTAARAATAAIEATSRAVQAMPAGHIESLAAAIDRLPGFAHAASGPVLAAVASPAYRDHAAQFLVAWSGFPETAGTTLALALRAASSARAGASSEQTVEVVWTGPTSHEIPVRRTREVLLGLVEAAVHRLTVVSFAAHKVPEVLAGLSNAAARGVDVRLILETAEDSGGRLSRDAAEAFESLRSSCQFFIWPLEQRAVAAGIGALHAKAVIADATAAFVTSANLTGHALTANMELGLLVRGGPVPGRLMGHFDELIAGGTLRRVR